ncbi:hypothetical protein GII31_10125 [Gordonia pseudamarae]|uniref:Ketosynthase family 3 (KS3) domain-containing protein n=1 Tax=Gordonia pseudamarae TaxID=2831662 RepID=A0ABX6IH79_9ACTN|nr:hypothetical protein GII31_10125 [Gordonia pseudamarae]
MSAIYPGETGLDGYWRTVSGGRDAITEVPPTHWLIDDYYDADPSVPDKTYCKRGGFIDPVPFDPVKFGLPPASLQTTDSAQILALIAAKQVLDKVTGGREDFDLDRTDIILGVASTTELVVQAGARLQGPVWRKAMLENGLSEAEAEEISGDIAAHYPPWVESTFPGLLGNVVAGRVANRLNLGGCNFVIDAACASSLASLQSALHRLYLHEADTVITGGVDALNDVMMYMCFSKTPAFSKTGDIRPLSDGADGTLIGEGVGMVALKRLDDAERDGDDIYRRHPWHRLLLGRPCFQRVRPAFGRAGQGGPRGLPARRLRPHDHRPARSTRHRHQGGRRRRVRWAQVGVHRYRQSHRNRLGEVPDRSHQGRGRCRWTHQSRSGAPAFHPSGNPQSGAAQPGDGYRGDAVLHQQHDPPVGAHRRDPAPGVGQFVRLRWHQFPRDPGAVRGCQPGPPPAHTAHRTRRAQRRERGRTGHPRRRDRRAGSLR